jgi:hypothetical protein
MTFYRELTRARQHGSDLLYEKSAERLIRAQRRHFMPGEAVPSSWGGST